jgi:hypothetical protein
MNDETKSEQTEPAEQTDRTQQPESQTEPTGPEPAEEIKKPKMCKLAVLSTICLVVAFAILLIYLKPGPSLFPITVEQLLIPIGIAAIAIAMVTGVIALVMIKASGGALAGRRLALLGIIVPIVVAVAYVRSLSPVVEDTEVVMPSSQCRSNISRLAEMISEYRGDNDGQFPKAEKWCDILLEQTETDESLFTCPLAKGGRCSYSLNKFAAEAGSDLPEDMVLLFESGPGWNQVGGPELFVALHQTRLGSTGCVAFADGKARFVSEDNVDTLNWNGVQDSEEAENEDEEPEEE